jgi:comEA protein
METSPRECICFVTAERGGKRRFRNMTHRIIAALLAFGAVIVSAVSFPAFAAKTPPTHKIDINLASAKELEELPGVGPTTAKAIIQFREKTGRFHRVEDLLAIRGISETKLAKMRPYIVVGAPPAKSAPPAPKKSPSPPASSH